MHKKQLANTDCLWKKIGFRWLNLTFRQLLGLETPDMDPLRCSLCLIDEVVRSYKYIFGCSKEFILIYPPKLWNRFNISTDICIYMCHAVIAFPSDSIRLIKCLKKIIIINCEYYIFWLKVITHKHEFVTCFLRKFYWSK